VPLLCGVSHEGGAPDRVGVVAVVRHVHAHLVGPAVLGGDVVSRSVKPDYEARRADQARAQDADRVTARVQRDLAFTEHGPGYGEWVEEVEKV